MDLQSPPPPTPPRPTQSQEGAKRSSSTLAALVASLLKREAPEFWRVSLRLDELQTIEAEQRDALASLEGEVLKRQRRIEDLEAKLAEANWKRAKPYPVGMIFQAPHQPSPAWLPCVGSANRVGHWPELDTLAKQVGWLQEGSTSKFYKLPDYRQHVMSPASWWIYAGDPA